MANATASASSASSASSRSSNHSAPAAAPAEARVPARLDDLLALEPAVLAGLYAGASVPRLPDLTGDLRGRMLAWQGVSGLPAQLIRTLASTSNFPWRGKTFQHSSDGAGGGDNRVVSDRFHLFKFDTFVGPSRAGAFESVQLDYDKPSNPFFIRAIKDEVRELRPGLWLGQAYLVVGKSEPRLVLYFGLEQRFPS
jgi:hypothetical protein